MRNPWATHVQVDLTPESDERVLAVIAVTTRNTHKNILNELAQQETLRDVTLERTQPPSTWQQAKLDTAAKAAARRPPDTEEQEAAAASTTTARTPPDSSITDESSLPPLDPQVQQGHEIDRVPRSASEESLLLRMRPPGWEYLYFGAVLRRMKNECEPRWQEHESRTRRPAGRALSDAEAPAYIARAIEQMGRVVRDLDRRMSPRSQRRAFGKPGKVGDEALIAALAADIVGCYSQFLEVSAQLRAEGVPPKYRRLADICSEMADAPLGQFRDFIDGTVEKLDGLPRAVREKRPVTLELIFNIANDEKVMERHRREIARLEGEEQRTAGQSAARDDRRRISAEKPTDWILEHDPTLNPPTPLKYRMRGYGGGPHHTSLHPRHWDSVKTVTFVPGIGYCRTREALPYLRRLIDARIRDAEAQLANHAKLEERIDVYGGSDRDEMIREAAKQRGQFEELIASLRHSRANLGRGRPASRPGSGRE
jgi:hypothetical protein